MTTYAILGDSGVGKTTFVNKLYLDNLYNNCQVEYATISNDVLTETPIIGIHGEHLDFYDFNGKYEYGTHFNQLKTVSCVIIMFDGELSLRRISFWYMGKVRNYCNREIPVIICANKIGIPIYHNTYISQSLGKNDELRNEARRICDVLHAKYIEIDSNTTAKAILQLLLQC